VGDRYRAMACGAQSTVTVVGKPFDRREYDATGWCHKLTCSTRHLGLMEDDLVYTTSDPCCCCSRSVTNITYGELGGVEKGKCCGVCPFVTSANLETMSPGCCDAALVDEIHIEMSTRMKDRGDRGQNRRLNEQLDIAEKLLGEVAKLDAKMQRSFQGDLRPLGMELPAAPEKQEFGIKEFFITNFPQWFCFGLIAFYPLLWCSCQNLQLGPEEVEYTECLPGACTERKVKAVYGEIGGVGMARPCCGCCRQVKAAGLNIPCGIMPMCGGCDPIGKRTAKEVLVELKARVRGRGDHMQMRIATHIAKIVTILHAEIAKLIGQTGHEAPSESLQEQEYDVTPCCTQFCYCGKRIMKLDDHEVSVTESTICGTETNHVAYGEVTIKRNQCCGCTSLNGQNLEETTPGCGQQSSLVDEIYAEMLKRIELRGSPGQLRRTTEALALSRASLADLAALHTKVDGLLAENGAAVSKAPLTTATAVPAQHTMKPAVIGASSSQHRPRREPFSSTEYDTSNIWEALCCCMCTKLRLEEEEAVFVRDCALCCYKGVNRMPYAEIGSVNRRQEGCNFFVSSKLFGEISPGCGCDEGVVGDIYSELGRRAQKHGDAGQTKIGLYAMDYMHRLANGVAQMAPKVHAMM